MMLQTRFCCCFEKGAPRAVLECSSDDVSAMHLIESGEVVKSFPTQSEAMKDPDASPMLERLSLIEAQISENERRFRKEIKSESLSQRQKRPAQSATKRREAMPDPMSKRPAEREAVISAVRRLSGTRSHVPLRGDRGAPRRAFC